MLKVSGIIERESIREWNFISIKIEKKAND